MFKMRFQTKDLEEVRRALIETLSKLEHAHDPPLFWSLRGAIGEVAGYVDWDPEEEHATG